MRRIAAFPADRGSRVVPGGGEKGGAEILGRRHAPLRHQIDQRRGAVFGDAEFAEDDRRSAEKAHDVPARGIEALPVGNLRHSRAVHDHRLESLGAHDRTEAAPAD